MLVTILLVTAFIGAIVVGLNDWYSPILSALFFALGTILIGIPLAFLFNFLLSRPMDKHYMTERNNLAVLQDSVQTQGAFFLGSGVIGGTPKYTFYREDGTGKKLESVDASTVTVYEDTDKPYLIRQTDCKTSMTWLAYCFSDERVTEIHVPKNTIKQNYVLDAH